MQFRYQKFLSLGQDSRKPTIARPYVPIYLSYKGKRTPTSFYALLDSGADSINFPSDLALAVGIKDITQGRKEAITGVGGQQTSIYFFDSEIEIVGDGRKLSVSVGFADNIYAPLLGRTIFKYFKSTIFHEQKEIVELKI